MYRSLVLCGLGLVSMPLLAQSDAAAERTELEPLTVTADPFAGRTPLESTQPVEVLAAEDLERSRAQTLGESLQDLPGVQSAEFAAGSSRPVIRGQGGPRVRILDGGAGVVDASTISPDHNAAVEPFRAQQIEVLKGPATLLYGSGAIGGVVNVVSDLLPQEPIHGAHGAIGTKLSTVDSGKTYFGHAEGGNGRLAFHIDGLTRETKDYEIPGEAEAEHEEETTEAGHEEHKEGVVENTATDTESLAAGLSWTGERGFVGLGVSHYSTLYGIPGHAHEEEAMPTDPADPPVEEEHAEHGGVRIDLEQLRYELRGGWQKDSGLIRRARGSVVLTEYEHRELEPAEEGQPPEVGTLFRNDGAELRLELTHRPLSRWTGVFGLQGTQQEFSATGEEAYVPPVDTRSAGLFVVEERQAGPGRISLGARVEQLEHQASGTNPDRDFTLYNLSAGWHQDLGPYHHFNVNLSHAERAPDVVELYANGPHLATLTEEQGNPDLDTERSLNLDLGHSGESGRWVYGIDLYYTWYSDYIFAEELAHAEEPGAEGHAEELTPIAYVQTDVDFWGGEVHSGYRFDERHSLTLFADMVRAEKANGEFLPRVPADRVGLRFAGGVGAWSYGLRLVAVRDQDRATELEEPTKGYTLLGADLSYVLPLGASELLLAVRGRNLLDEEARNHVSFLKSQAPLPGANVQFDLEWRF